MRDELDDATATVQELEDKVSVLEADLEDTRESLEQQQVSGACVAPRVRFFLHSHLG